MFETALIIDVLGQFCSCGNLALDNGPNLYLIKGDNYNEGEAATNLPGYGCEDSAAEWMK